MRQAARRRHLIEERQRAGRCGAADRRHAVQVDVVVAPGASASPCTASIPSLISNYRMLREVGVALMMGRDERDQPIPLREKRLPPSDGGKPAGSGAMEDIDGGGANGAVSSSPSLLVSTQDFFTGSHTICNIQSKQV